MKKLVLAIGLSMIASVARAETSLSNVLGKLPTLKQGVCYSLNDSRFNYLATIDVLNFSGFNLEVGYAGVAKFTADKAVAVISYDLLSLKDIGVKVPILDLVSLRPGIYAGAGRIEGFQDGRLKAEADFGASLSVIDIKF